MALEYKSYLFVVGLPEFSLRNMNRILFRTPAKINRTFLLSVRTNDVSIYAIARAKPRACTELVRCRDNLTRTACRANHEELVSLRLEPCFDLFRWLEPPAETAKVDSSQFGSSTSFSAILVSTFSCVRYLLNAGEGRGA